MTKLHTGITISLVLIFAGTIIGYSFYQPYRPGEVLKAIPPGVSRIHHEDSLEKLLLNPVCVAQLNQALGAGNSLQKLLASTAWENKVIPAEVAVAYIPEYDAWASVSWVGWRSPWLRWKLDHVSDEMVKPLKHPLIWPMWTYESDEIARGKKIYFALTENLFLVCLADHKNAMLQLLDTYDRNTPIRND